MAQDSLKKDIIWNLLGTLLYALSSIVLAMGVLRLQGAAEGGVFGFGFSTLGQQIFIIAYFGLRPFHITDTAGEYGFLDYLLQRRLTCLFAVLSAALFLLAMLLSGHYAPEKALVLFLLALYKTADGFADVYESECQRSGLLYLGGRALFFRTLVSASGLLAALVLTKNLAASCAIAVFLQFSQVALYRRAGLYAPVCVRPGKGAKEKAAALTKQGALLFVSVFLDFFIFSSAKYAVDLRLGDEADGIFNIIFMPASVIYLGANFLIKPYMTRLSEMLEKGDHASFRRTSRGLEAAVLGLTAACVLGSLLLGRPALSLIDFLTGNRFGSRMTDCCGIMTLIVLGGGLYAAANLWYYVLVMLRQQKLIFAVYCAGALPAAMVCGPAAGRFGMAGGAFCFLGLMAFLCAAFRLLAGRMLKKERTS